MTSRDKLILQLLDIFAKLQRQATDEVGWISMKLSITREEAAKAIDKAKGK